MAGNGWKKWGIRSGVILTILAILAAIGLGPDISVLFRKGQGPVSSLDDKPLRAEVSDLRGDFEEYKTSHKDWGMAIVGDFNNRFTSIDKRLERLEKDTELLKEGQQTTHDLLRSVIAMQKRAAPK